MLVCFYVYPYAPICLFALCISYILCSHAVFAYMYFCLCLVYNFVCLYALFLSFVFINLLIFVFAHIHTLHLSEPSPIFWVYPKVGRICLLSILSIFRSDRIEYTVVVYCLLCNSYYKSRHIVKKKKNEMQKFCHFCVNDVFARSYIDCSCLRPTTTMKTKLSMVYQESCHTILYIGS